MKFPFDLMQAEEIKAQMNILGRHQTPFFFIINYHGNAGLILEMHELSTDKIRFAFHENKRRTNKQIHLFYETNQKELYQRKFNSAQLSMQSGIPTLINLTQATKIQTKYSLMELYELAHAPYKLWIKDSFLVFSPETFVKINAHEIKAFPMKGTIDASVPNAKKTLLHNPKELHEHNATVDLLVQELSAVATNIHVTKDKYIEKIKSSQHQLLQLSSEITGTIHEKYRHYLGDLMFTLLPAASICGVPKDEAQMLISKIEDYDRGFYTGVCGYFDGENLDTAVMIRFVEQQDDGLYYKSGGGISPESDLDKEYKELIQKIYVPIS